MLDWAPVVVGVVLFVLLSPGLLFLLPGTRRCMDFGCIDFYDLRTTGKSIFVHTLIFFTVYCIIILRLNVHIYTAA